MTYLSLYRKYRPQTFAEILGQEHVSRTLANAIAEDRVAHAYLFTGPRGTGKTSTARILAKALNCVDGPTPEPCGKCASCIAIAQGSSLDVFELDAASHSGVDETREILSGVSLATAGGRKKVYVIDEVHMLTQQSFNALLKTLEEPPDHVIFVLATTEAHKVLPTIVSRTQRFDFRRAAADDLEQLLGEIAKKENIDIEPDAVAVIARHSEGSFRDAVASLEQLASLGDAVAVADAERMLGERGEDALIQVFDAIAAGDLGGLFSTLHLLVAQGVDIRRLTLSAMSHARSLLLLRTAPDASGMLDLSAEDRATLAVQAESFSPETIVRVLDLLGKALTEMRNAPNHRLLLEVALVRAAAPDTDPTASGLLGRIERLERRIGIAGDEPVPVQQAPAAAPAPKPAPKAAPASKPQPAAARSTAGVGLGDMRDSWNVTLAELDKRSKRVAALLKPSRPVSFDGDVLRVEVQSKFHRDEMSEPSSLQLLAESIHAALGVKPSLSFVTRGEEPSDEPEPEPQVADIAEAKAVEEADAVELVKKGLGAEVVEERSNR
jgi:DNA polymerase III subunit gamma/tau